MGETLPYATPPSPPSREDLAFKELARLHYLIGAVLVVLGLGAGVPVLAGGIDGDAGSFWTKLAFWCAIAFLTVGAVTIVSGWSINLRKDRDFSIAVAFLNCPFVPLGTFLGIYTILVLRREEMKAQYPQKKSPPLSQ
jgi:hypothetical protein